MLVVNENQLCILEDGILNVLSLLELYNIVNLCLVKGTTNFMWLILILE